MPVKRITVCHLFGFAIRADVGFFYLFALISWSLAEGLFPRYVGDMGRMGYWLLALASALLFLASLLVHELAHAIVGKRHGIPITGITLFLFGGISELDEEPRDPAAELWMASAGPAASIVLAGLFHQAALHGDRAGLGILPRSVCAYLASANVLVALFNLTPAFPLDGGRIVRALLWKWRGLAFATRWAAKLGMCLGLVVMACGVAQLFLGNPVGGMWWAVVGLFVRFAAGRSLAPQHRTSPTRVARLIRPLEQLRRFRLVRREPAPTFPVAPEMHSLAAEHSTPRETPMPLGATLHPNVITISRDASIGDAARLMREHHIGSVVVVETRHDGRLVPIGILTDRDIVIELVAEDLPVDRVRAADIMSPDLVTAREGNDAAENIALMTKNGVKRLPVVDASGALVGIYSADDFLETVAKEILGLARLPRRQLQIEKRLRA